MDTGRVSMEGPAGGHPLGTPMYVPSSLRNSLVSSESKFPHRPHVWPRCFSSTRTCSGRGQASGLGFSPHLVTSD